MEIYKKVQRKVAGNSMGRMGKRPGEKIHDGEGAPRPQESRQAQSWLTELKSQQNKGVGGLVSRTIHKCQNLHL